MTEAIQAVDLNVVNRLIVVVPRFTQWSGSRAMHPADYKVGTDGALPPKAVTRSLGQKAIIDPEDLTVFSRIKGRADSLLESIGVRFLSGWAIPEDKANEVFAKLDAIVAEYGEAKTAFLANYDDRVALWAQKNPEFAREIMDGKLDRADVDARISATYEPFRLAPASPEKAQALASSVDGLSSDLIRSVSQMARQFFKESILGKDRASRKTVNVVRRMRDRLSGLSFLSTRILPVIGLIDAVIAKVPSEGYFTGAPFWELATLVRTLGDESLLASVMDGTLTDGTDSVTLPAESVLPIAETTEQTAETEPDLFRATADAAKAVGAVATTVTTSTPAANVIPPPVVLPKVDVGDGFYF